MATERLRQFASAAAAAAVSLTRPNYFDTSKKGEVYELRSELNSDLELARKEAVKKVIASMTIGKDVSSLFPDVLKNIQTEDLELKKLVYLYLMNHAKSQPELVILAINTFCKDAGDPNPLVRALAIRTMGCLRVDKVLDYLCEPLQRALKDENAYVRKTAVVCAAKVVELSPELAEENGFIDILKSMLSDSNATVVANVVAALSDIQEMNPEMGAFEIDSRTALRLVSALNDCTEWGQIAILDILAKYFPSSMEEALDFMEKIAPRLQHANSSVVMSAVKVILVYLNIIPSDHEFCEVMNRKLAPPLVSMLASPPEVQYVVMRNLNIILQRHGHILVDGARVFFCKFNDPLYVKLEKLEIIVILCAESSFSGILDELYEYSKEVDAEFAKRAILAIAECGVKVPAAAEKAFSILEQLIRMNVNFALQAAAQSLQILLRAYPDGRADLILALLSGGENGVEIYDDDESRAAIVWMLGQYDELLDEETLIGLLQSFLSNFALEPSLVQSELLTSSLKLFFSNPNTYRETFSAVIRCGLGCNDNANIRERSLIYGRILEVDPQLLAGLQMSDAKAVTPQMSGLDEEMVDALIPYLSTVASVYHRLPEESICKSVLASAASRIAHKPPPLPDLLNLDDENGDGSASAVSFATSPAMESSSNRPIIDLLAD